MADFRIVPRAEWGALDPRGSMARFYGKPRELWIHHSGIERHLMPDDPHAQMRQVQRVAFGRGFSDFSYTFAIATDGTIMEGRDRRYVGAHTKDRNAWSWAICFLGHYSQMEPTQRQMDAARWLIDHLVATGEIDRPRHTLPTGGHRDNPASPSECCGNNLYRRLGELRQPYAPPIVHPFPEEPKVPVPVKPNVPQRIDVVETPQGFQVYCEYLDVDGNGWVSLPVARERIVGVLGRGSNPETEGYWPLCVFGLNERGDETVVTIKGQPYQRGVLFWVVER